MKKDLRTSPPPHVLEVSPTADEADATVLPPMPNQDDIDAEAAHWAVRLGDGPLNATARRALADWLAASAAHGAALHQARAAWALMAEVDAAGLVAVPQPSRPGRNPLPRLTTLAALAASILLVVAAGLGLRCGDPLVALRADHHTAIGESRAVTLPDGSVVRLAPASAIVVQYGPEQRRVELLTGQADFTAAPRNAAEPRPFVVAAGDGRIRALGTRFMVGHLPDAVEVAVAEHVVEVEQDVATTPRRLKPGQGLRYGAAGLGPVEEIPYAQAAAWQDGTLVFDRAPLAEIAATLNRYRPGRIVIGDPSLAARTASGVFDAANPDAALNAVVAALGIRSATLPPFVTLLY